MPKLRRCRTVKVSCDRLEAGHASRELLRLREMPAPLPDRLDDVLALGRRQGPFLPLDLRADVDELHAPPEVVRVDALLLGQLLGADQPLVELLAGGVDLVGRVVGDFGLLYIV